MVPTTASWGEKKISLTVRRTRGRGRGERERVETTAVRGENRRGLTIELGGDPATSV